jgi:hypothetical protein
MHWKTPAAQVGGTRRRAKTPTDSTQKQDEVQGVPASSAASAGVGETVTINLGAAGSVVVHVAVKWLELDDATFVALRRAISDLKDLANLSSGDDDDFVDPEGGDDD